MISWLIAAIAVERITELLITSKIFEPLRDIITQCAFPPQDAGLTHVSKIPPWSHIDRTVWSFLYNLLSCGLCTSVWVAGFSMLYINAVIGNTDNSLFDIGSSNGFIIKWVALFGLSNAYHVIYMIVYKGRIHALDIAVAVKEEDNNGRMGRDSNGEAGSEGSDQSQNTEL